MNDNISESTTTAITFRFASGQILSLDEDQIEKILYLAAVVSSADHFESTRDGDGYYKLDSHIEFTHFSFVLESLSFHYPDGENKNFLEHQLNLDHFQVSDEFVVFWGPTLEKKDEFLLQRYRNRH